MEELNFDEMRNQIAILKTKLDKQEIINDRMIHEAISTKADNMKRKMYVSIICAIFVICAGPFSFREVLGASWAFIIGTDIMMIYCMVREFLYKRELSNNALMNASLLDVAKKMGDFKKSYKRYTIINMLVLLPVWFGWLIIETILKNESTLAYNFIIGLAVGLVIGAIIGLNMYFKIQDTASDIIKQIEE